MITSIFKPNLQSYPKKLRTGLNADTPKGIFCSRGKIFIGCAMTQNGGLRSYSAMKACLAIPTSDWASNQLNKA